MKNPFKPDESYKTILDLTPEKLKAEGIIALILDVDNTLTTHDNPVPANGVTEWIESMKAAEIKLIIVSNNHAPRVQPFADALGIDFVCEGAKPLRKGFNAAVERLGVPKREICAIGDQIFTDILGASLSGIRSVLVDPIELESGTFFKIKRFCEKLFRPKV